jgi:hypothetical protein
MIERMTISSLLKKKSTKCSYGPWFAELKKYHSIAESSSSSMIKSLGGLDAKTSRPATAWILSAGQPGQLFEKIQPKCVSLNDTAAQTLVYREMYHHTVEAFLVLRLKKTHHNYPLQHCHS